MTQEEINDEAYKYALARYGDVSAETTYFAEEVSDAVYEAFKAGAQFTQPQWVYLPELPTLYKIVEAAFLDNIDGEHDSIEAHHNGEDWIDADGELMLSRKVYAWRDRKKSTPPPLKP